MFNTFVSPCFGANQFIGFGGGSFGFTPGLSFRGGFSPFGFGGINAIGSQFNNQSFINTGVASGTVQTQSPVNIF